MTRRILVVDDSPINIETIRAHLRGEGYDILGLESGPEALARVEEFDPDLVLLDLMMPEMSGIEVLRELRARPGVGEVPVIIVTALDDPSTLEEAFQEGADDFLTKPLRGIQLRVRVRGMVRLNRYRRLVAERERREGLEKDRLDLERTVRQLVDQAGILAMFFKLDGSITWANSCAADTLGYSREELNKLRMPDLVALESKVACDSTMADLALGIGKKTCEMALMSASGTRIEVIGAAVPHSLDGAVVGGRVLFIDVTEKTLLREQLFQAQKMEQVGRLTAGIAHNFGNVLAVMSMNGHALKHGVKDEALRPAIEDIIEAANDGREMIQGLMGLSRQASLDMVPQALGEILTSTVKTLSRIMPKTVQMSVTGESTSGVLSDGTAVRQILVNLATNACDAMEERGRLTFSLRDVGAGHAPKEAQLEGPCVVIELEDTGPGISPDVMEEIFDPFFTTKEVEKGTGLGLATVKGLMAQMGGYVTVTSTLGVGAVFSLWFPATTDETGVKVSDRV